MLRRILFALTLFAVVGIGAGCDDDSCSPNGLCYLAEAEFTEEIPVTTQMHLMLDGINGNVDIDADPGADRVTVSGTRSVRSDSEPDAEQRLEDLKVEIGVNGDIVRIMTEQPVDTEGRSYTVDYDVTIPADMIPQVHTVNGNVRSSGTRAGTVLAVVNGNIDAVDMRGFVSLATVNGDVRADAVLSGEDEVVLLAVNGRLDLTVPSETSALVYARVTNGIITVRDLVLADQVRTNTSLTGRLGDGDGDINLQTTNGNVTLRGR